eukprot:CAMPEP_0181419724 /NCGR_PEP_ID=MMETSP1110-20121109/12221_1 /TAXON_ID=174948 /ORGANISM="Symbiodinium sp., Strain CCMP421" /LENGTH=93 /DNA_ID=CAMNT_0023542749 /DNA_START=293 /DNA_END=575 /DNA_ORIENTATION=+
MTTAALPHTNVHHGQGHEHAASRVQESEAEAQVQAEACGPFLQRRPGHLPGGPWQGKEQDDRTPLRQEVEALEKVDACMKGECGTGKSGTKLL